MAEIDGATLIARSLKQQGINHLFGVVGFPVGPIAAAAQKEGVAYVGMRNEQAASYAARAYGYLTGRPGACIVVTGPGVVHGLAGLADAQQNCWPMILIGGASETYRGGMGAFQEERQVVIASPFCKFAHAIDTVERIPYYVEMATRHAIYGRPGATYLDMPDNIITGKCDEKNVVEVQKAPAPPRTIAPQENIEQALGLLERAERPLVLVGKGMAWADAESEVRSFIEKTQLPFLRSPMGKGIMPDDHPLSVAAARTLALQNADVVFLMGARFNWIFHFGQPPRYAKDMKVIQLDIAPEEIGHNKATEVALVGDGKAIMQQLNTALGGRQWFHPKESPWRQMIAKKAAENAAQIKPQIDDDSAPATYYRAFKDIAAWMPKNSILSAEGAGTMDIGLTMLPVFSAKACLNAGTYGTMGLGLGAGDRGRRRAPRPPGHPSVGRLGDRFQRHGDGDAGALQPSGQDRRLEQWRHRPGHGGNPGKPDVQHAAEHADLRRPLRQGHGSLRRQGLFCRGPERHQGRARRGDEPSWPRPGQHRAQPRLGEKAASLPLAQLTPSIPSPREEGVRGRSARSGPDRLRQAAGKRRAASWCSQEWCVTIIIRQLRTVYVLLAGGLLCPLARFGGSAGWALRR